MTSVYIHFSKWVGIEYYLQYCLSQSQTYDDRVAELFKPILHHFEILTLLFICWIQLLLINLHSRSTWVQVLLSESKNLFFSHHECVYQIFI